MIPAKSLPSAEYLNECFEYKDGFLIWKERPRYHFESSGSWKRFNVINSGRIAGSLHRGRSGDRYDVMISGISYKRSRIVFSMFRGATNKMIDHIDRDTKNDSIENLREATNSQNRMNSKLSSNNQSGYKGVYCHKYNGRFMSRIRLNGKSIFLGYFDDPESAHKAYCEASLKYHGEFSRTK